MLLLLVSTLDLNSSKPIWSNQANLLQLLKIQQVIVRLPQVLLLQKKKDFMGWIQSFKADQILKEHFHTLEI